MLHLMLLTFAALAGAVSGVSFDDLNNKVDWVRHLLSNRMIGSKQASTPLLANSIRLKRSCIDVTLRAGRLGRIQEAGPRQEREADHVCADTALVRRPLQQIRKSADNTPAGVVSHAVLGVS